MRWLLPAVAAAGTCQRRGGADQLAGSRPCASTRTTPAWCSGWSRWTAPRPPPPPQTRGDAAEGQALPAARGGDPGGRHGRFPNLDPIFHNAFSNFSGQPFDIGLYPPSTSRSVTFKHPGIVRVFCNIHPTMSAIIAVLNTPWFAVTQATGKYSIANVPAGRISTAHLPRARAAGEPAVPGAPHHRAGERAWRCR